MLCQFYDFEKFILAQIENLLMQGYFKGSIPLLAMYIYIYITFDQSGHGGNIFVDAFVHQCVNGV